MEGRLGALQFIEHLLIKLLTRTQTCELHFHILGTRQFDHPLRQIGNLHGLSHVEDENLTAITLRASL